MKKRIFSALLVLLMLVLTLPFSAAAATEPTAEDLKTPPVISNLEIHDDGEGFVWLEVTVETPANVLNAINWFENHELGYNQAGWIGQIDLQYSIDGGEWQESALSLAWKYYEDAEEYPEWSGIHETYYLDELHVDSEVKARARYNGADAEGNPRYSDWSNMLTLNEPIDFESSSWAKEWVSQAYELDLIPASLMGANMKEPVTRAEFAAISLNAFRAITFSEPELPKANPFTDTADEDVLRAYAVGITNGTGDGTVFKPNDLLNREQAATMLTRVYKKVMLSGWTLETDKNFDAEFKAGFTMPAPFPDDADISGWAKDSVYFMKATEIINGFNDGTFRPRAIASKGQAESYAQATREQVLKMAVQMVKNLTE